VDAGELERRLEVVTRDVREHRRVLDDMGLFDMAVIERKAFASAMRHELTREATAVKLERARLEREHRNDRHIAYAAAIGTFMGGLVDLFVHLLGLH
jgi:hypothetical protein